MRVANLTVFMQVGDGKVQPEMSLYFRRLPLLRLEKTHFLAEDGQEYEARRGKPRKGKPRACASFEWREGVKSLTILLLRHVAWGLRDREGSPPVLEGCRPSAATSLADVIQGSSNAPQWLDDMFGLTEDGAAHIVPLVQKHGSGDKSLPVQILMIPDAFPPSNVDVFLDDKLVEDAGVIKAMADQIEQSEPSWCSAEKIGLQSDSLAQTPVPSRLDEPSRIHSEGLGDDPMSLVDEAASTPEPQPPSSDHAVNARGSIDIFEVLSEASASLSSHLRVRESKTLVEERTKTFIGRKHIFKAIDDAIAHPDFPSGYLVVTGEPGIGKTAIAAELVKRRGYVHHFNVAVEGIRSPRAFLANVCAQVIVRYGLPYATLPAEAVQDSGFLSELLAQAAAKTDAGPIVIVVDALDEADESEVPASANRLYLPQDLPDHVFFVVTIREKHDDRLLVSRKRPVPLIDRDPLNMDDAREYVCRFVADHAAVMAERIRDWGVSEGQFVETLANKGDGNFQYLRHVLPDIRDRRLSVDNIGSIHNFPIGLRDYYLRHWRTMKDRDRDRYLRFQRPILCFLATVKEPIPIACLVEWTQLPRSAILDVIKEWREFLNERRRAEEAVRYHIYHSSFAEFLEQEEGLKEFHAIIVDAGRQAIREIEEEVDRNRETHR